jgi:hypothetical protein
MLVKSSIGLANGGSFLVQIQFRGLALALALSTVTVAARAEVIVSGTLDDLHIEANRAPILEVLDALKQRFGIVYQYHARPDWIIDGSFSGSLSSILPRIFRDEDYAYRIDANNSLIVFMVSPQGPPVVLPVPPPPVQAVMIGGTAPSQPVPVARQIGHPRN